MPAAKLELLVDRLVRSLVCAPRLRDWLSLRKDLNDDGTIDRFEFLASFLPATDEDLMLAKTNHSDSDSDSDGSAVWCSSSPMLAHRGAGGIQPGIPKQRFGVSHRQRRQTWAGHPKFGESQCWVSALVFGPPS